MSGYILMHRGWQDNPIFDREEYSRRDAWVWLIEACCFRITDKACCAIPCQAGEAAISIASLSRRFCWRRAEVAKFLQDLSDAEIFTISFIGEDVCRILLPSWGEHVDSAPSAPTLIDIPQDWPNPPPERRHIASRDRRAIQSKRQCAYCGDSNHRSNLTLACRKCNLSKSNKPLSKWMRGNV